MSCKCCDNTKDLGCVENCGIQFITGAVAPVGAAGEWVLYIEYNRRNYAYKNTLIEGQEINFNVGCLNPYYTYIAYITKPDGTTAIFTVNGQGYDCFSFSTKLESAAGVNVGATAVG
jgi:hypothetical protein